MRIAFAGSGRPTCARARPDASTAKYRELGTVGNLLSFDRLGALPTRNFQDNVFAGAERLAGEALRTGRRHVRGGCAHCTIGCAHAFGFGDGGTTRVEYESLFALGPLVGVEDPDVVLAAARRCDDLGLDTISTGVTLGFAMECGERGWLADTPRFGDGAALGGWIDAIAHRSGLGDRLAEGTRRLGAEIGEHALAIAPQVKGLEMPGYEPRALQSMALGLAVGTRGADHNRSGAYEADLSLDVDRLRGDARSVAGAIAAEDRAALMDALVLCKFVRGAMNDFWGEAAALLEAVTGFDVTAPELRSVARRIVALRKAYNEREGWTPAEDTLPARFLEEPLPAGPVAGTRLPAARLRALIEGYNRERGWSLEGHLPEATWRELEATLGLRCADGAGGSGDGEEPAE